MRYGQTITVRITADGSAFESDPAGEMARVLRSVAARLSDGWGISAGNLLDGNGITCGTVRVTGRGRTSAGAR